MKRQRGMVLILVMFVVGLLSMLAYGVVTRQYLDLQGLNNLAMQTQARSYALAAEAFAINLLVRDFRGDRESGARADHEEDVVDEPWGSRAVQLPISEGTGIEGQIDDLSGRFNLNSLVLESGDGWQINPAQVARLKRFIDAQSNVDWPASLLVEHFVDWLDSDSQSTNFQGAESDIYQLREPPYRSADQPFNDVSELWLIEGMTAPAWVFLSEKVSLLPPGETRINVNTADAALLRAYIPGLEAAAASELLERRRELQGFTSPQQFFEQQALAGLELPRDEIVVHSSYFQATLRAVVDGRVTRLVSRLYRDDQGNVFVQRRDFGKRNDLTKPVVIVQ